MLNINKFAGMVWYDEAGTISRAVFYRLYVKFKLEKEEIRLGLINDLTFQIEILEQAESMNVQSELYRNRKFLGWTEEHSKSLNILKQLRIYLQDNKDNWTHAHYFNEINKIPYYETKDVPSEDTRSLPRND